MFLFSFKDCSIFLVAGQLAHIKLFLLSKAAGVEMNNQNKPNQSSRENQPANTINGKVLAPAAQKKGNPKKDNAQNQRCQSYVFGAFGWDCHILFQVLYYEQKV
jgi:hypothetical protein